MKRFLLFAIAAVCCALLAAPVQAATVDFGDLDGIGTATATIPLATTDPIVVEKVYTFTELVDGAAPAINMAVSNVATSSITIMEKITNGSGFAWSDFQWNLQGDVATFDITKFTVSTPGLNTEDFSVGTSSIVYNGNTPNSGPASTIEISYTVNLNGESSFVVEQVDSLTAVPVPGVGVALASMSIMLGFGTLRRKKA